MNKDNNKRCVWRVRMLLLPQQPIQSRWTRKMNSASEVNLKPIGRTNNRYAQTSWKESTVAHRTDDGMLALVLEKFCSSLITTLCPILLQLHGLLPTRCFCWSDFPGKNIGAGCHFLLQGSSQPRDQTQISCIGRQILYCWTTRDSQLIW